MPTKNQSKTAINAAVADIIADIDNILPTGVNIKDGHLSFGPTRYTIIIDAGGSSATALSWLTSIQNALTAANRPPFTVRGDRRADEATSKSIRISETKLTVIIINF